MRTYDFIFSLGAACSCSQCLRLANLQFASFPCDWLWGGTPQERAFALTGGFGAYLDEAKLVRHGIPWKLEHEPWRHAESGIVFKHDFDWNTPLAETLPAVRAKYERRRARLDALVRQSKRVLAVWLNPPTRPQVAVDAFLEARKAFAAKWPDVAFDFLITQCEKGRPFESRTDSETDGVRTVCWDYDDGREEFVDNQKMAKFLASEYAMRDYRTDEERAAWPERQRKLRFAQYNAATWWGYVVNKAWYRLYRHVRKEIERRGLNRLG